MKEVRYIDETLDYFIKNCYNEENIQHIRNKERNGRKSRNFT